MLASGKNLKGSGPNDRLSDVELDKECDQRGSLVSDIEYDACGMNRFKVTRQTRTSKV